MRASLVIALFSIGLAAAQPADYPHAFPRQGAKIVLDNAQGTVWEVVWPRNVPTAMHRHRFDYMGVELEDAQVRVTTVDGQSHVASPKRDSAWFLPRNTTHIEEGLTTNPTRHAVIIDIKDNAPPAANCGSPIARNGAKSIADNARAAIWEYTWPSAATAASCQRSAFIVFTSGGEISVASATGRPKTIAVSRTQVLFRPAGRESEYATKGNVRGFIFELK
jgi:hypothetical protein